MYKLLNKNIIKKYYLDIAEKEKVSEVARNPGGFMYWYLNDGKTDKLRWMNKRNNFIKRHMEQWKKAPENRYRQFIALIMWGYSPFEPMKYYGVRHPITRKKYNLMVERYNELKQRKTTGEQTEEDKQRKTKPSKCTEYFKDNNIPTNKKELSRYIKKRTGTKKTLKEIKNILETIEDRGIKAWETAGSRPGANKYQWGKARVYCRVEELLENRPFKSDGDILNAL